MENHVKIIKIIFLLCALQTTTNLEAREIRKFKDKTDKVEFLIATKDSELKEIPFNKITTLVLRIENSKAKDIKFNSFDCRMPAHDHGMVTKPKIIPIDENTWEIQGFKLHMKGEWKFILWFTIDDKDQKVDFPYTF